MDVTLSDSQLKLIIQGLHMKINYIQTGDPILSSEDAQTIGKSGMIKALDEDQMRLILSMKDSIRAIESVISTHKNARLIGV